MAINALMQGLQVGNNIFDRRRNMELDERDYADAQAQLKFRNNLLQREQDERTAGRQAEVSAQEKQWLSNAARTLAGLAKNPATFNQAADFFANDPIAKKFGIPRESITPDSVMSLVAQMDMQAGAAPMPAQKPDIRSVGGALVDVTDPEKARAVYSSPTDGETPVNRQLTTRPVGNGKVQDFGYNPRTNKLEPVGEAYDADPGGVNTRKGAMPLRKEFRNLQSVKDYETVLPLIKSAEKAPDTGYGDLQLIYTVGKTLDPGSVVREGELALTIAAGSPLQRVLGATRFNFEKGGRLTAVQRKQIIDMLNQRVAAAKTAYDRDFNQYSGYAKDSGVDPSMVVGNAFNEAFEPKTQSLPPIDDILNKYPPRR